MQYYKWYRKYFCSTYFTSAPLKDHHWETIEYFSPHKSEDTSKRLTMALQDSMLKPSVFRSPSANKMSPVEIFDYSDRSIDTI